VAQPWAARDPAPPHRAPPVPPKPSGPPGAPHAPAPDRNGAVGWGRGPSHPFTPSPCLAAHRMVKPVVPTDPLAFTDPEPCPGKDSRPPRWPSFPSWPFPRSGITRPEQGEGTTHLDYDPTPSFRGPQGHAVPPTPPERRRRPSHPVGVREGRGPPHPHTPLPVPESRRLSTVCY